MLASRCAFALALALSLFSLATPVAEAQSARRVADDRDVVVAIIRGDTDALAKFIAEEPEVAARRLGAVAGGNRRDLRPTGLAIAVRNHRMAAARLLLKAGADPGRQGGVNEGLLLRAYFPEMIELLVEYGAAVTALPEASSYAGLGAFQGASRRAQANRQALVKLGMVVGEPTPIAFGWSLDGAPQPGKADDAPADLWMGAPVELDTPGWEPMPGLRLLDIGEWLAEEGDLLDLTIDSGAVGRFDRLIEAGFSPSRSAVLLGTEEELLRMRSMRAAWRGHGDILERLLAETDRLELGIKFAELQLTAASAGHTALLTTLVKRAGFVSVHAAALGDVPTLRQLVTLEPSLLESRDFICAATPLAYAVIADRNDAAACLLELGADANVTIDRRVAQAHWRGDPGTRMPDRRDPWDAALPMPEVDSISLLEAALIRRNDDMALGLVESGARVDSRAFELLVGGTSTQASQLLDAALGAGLVAQDSVDWAHGALKVLLRRSTEEAGAVVLIDRILALLGPGDLRSEDGESVIDSGFSSGASLELLRQLFDLGGTVSEETAVALGWRGEERARSLVDGLDEQRWESLLHRSSRRADPAAYERVLSLRTGLTEPQALKQAQRLAYMGRLDLIDIAARSCSEGYEPARDPEVLTNGAGLPDFVRLLLARGADPNHRPPSGFGPLHHAAREGSLDAVRILLEAGANPRARSSNGRAPLYEVTFAADSMSSPKQETRVLGVIEALLEAGADPLSVDDAGRVTYEQLQYQDWSPEGEAALSELLAKHMNPDWL